MAAPPEAIECSGNARAVEPAPGQGKSKAAKARQKLKELQLLASVAKKKTPDSNESNTTPQVSPQNASLAWPLLDQLDGLDDESAPARVSAPHRGNVVQYMWFAMSLLLVLLGSRWGSEMGTLRKLETLDAKVMSLQAQQEVAHCLPSQDGDPDDANSDESVSRRTDGERRHQAAAIDTVLRPRSVLNGTGESNVMRAVAGPDKSRMSDTCSVRRCDWSGDANIASMHVAEMSSTGATIMAAAEAAAIAGVALQGERLADSKEEVVARMVLQMPETRSIGTSWIREGGLWHGEPLPAAGLGTVAPKNASWQLQWTTQFVFSWRYNRSLPSLGGQKEVGLHSSMVLWRLPWARSTANSFLDPQAGWLSGEASEHLHMSTRSFMSSAGLLSPTFAAKTCLGAHLAAKSGPAQITLSADGGSMAGERPDVLWRLPWAPEVAHVLPCPGPSDSEARRQQETSSLHPKATWRLVWI